jgi:hypothetical protein
MKELAVLESRSKKFFGLKIKFTITNLDQEIFHWK